MPIVLRIPVEELPDHLATLESELEGGRRIELVRGDAVVAEVRARTPELMVPATRPEMPDFMARLKRIYGDKVYEDSTQWIREDRDAQY